MSERKPSRLRVRIAELEGKVARLERALATANARLREAEGRVVVVAPPAAAVEQAMRTIESGPRSPIHPGAVSPRGRT